MINSENERIELQEKQWKLKEGITRKTVKNWKRWLQGKQWKLEKIITRKTVDFEGENYKKNSENWKRLSQEKKNSEN